MKKHLFYLNLCFFSLTTTIYAQADKRRGEKDKTLTAKETKLLKKKHSKFLVNSPFKKTLKMNKEERQIIGLPPNKYFEEMYELTINPSTGKTHPENITLLQESLENERLVSRTPGDAADNPWVERGPNNVGGRTRAILFDPNDATARRVFAGSASGGLWVTNDITAANTAWTRVAGVPGNLNVSCITVDPNNSNTWYLGTGEMYTFGDAIGNGVYKTTDGGSTWVSVPVAFNGATFNFNATNIFLAGVYYVTDIIARNNAGTTEIYLGVGSAYFGSSSAAVNQWNGPEQAGLYKSTNGGDTWVRNQDAAMLASNTGGRNYYAIPNDLELDINNNIWFSCSNTTLGTGGGRIYRSIDGNTFTLRATIANAKRTEIEPSGTNANKFYILYQRADNNKAAIAVTTDAFATVPTNIVQPDDADTGIPADDFTRGQAFYDLVIEANPENDAIVYIGGIDLFRSADSGTTWTQISKWSNNNNLAALNCSLVHADHHIFTFRPGFLNQAVSGNDGGISYCSNLLTAGGNTNFTTKNSGYNVTQFYSMGVAPTQAVSGLANDYFVAGAQDNGTQYFANKLAGAVTSSVTAQGGDGAYSFFDQDNGQYYITNYVYNNNINYRTTAGVVNVINNENLNRGAFIAPMTLDSNLNILYSDYTADATYQIRRYSGLGGLIDRTLLANPLLTNSPTALKVSRYTAASTTLLVGTKDGRVLRITNANGAAPVWTNITGPGFVGSVSDVEFGQNENQIFVTFHNYGVTSVWYSSNGGVTWSSIEGNLPDIPVRCVLQNPLNTAELIIGTDLGVWYANTFNPASAVAQALDWRQSYNGMSDVKVTDLQLQAYVGVPEVCNVYASTYGRGVFTGQFRMPQPLSVNNNNDLANNSIKVYPAISNGIVTVSSCKTYGNTKLSLFDLSGKKVYESEVVINSDSNIINFGKLSTGEYLLKLSGEGFDLTKKLLIE